MYKNIPRITEICFATNQPLNDCVLELIENQSYSGRSDKIQKSLSLR